MKRTVKIIVTILLFITIINTIATTAFAANFDIRDIFNYARSFPSSGSEISEADLKEMQATIFNLLTWIGIIVAVVGSIVIGIQFIMSTPDGKAAVNAKMIPFVIGCAVIFMGLTIWRIAVRIAQDMMPG